MSSATKILLVLVGLAVVFGIVCVSSYNGLVGLQQATDAQWAQVQNVYQRRTDLVPNLVSTVSGAANFEKSTLMAVTEARASVGRVQMPSGTAPTDPAQLAAFQQAQGQLGSALSRLLVVSEQYPDLKATAGFRDLQAQLEGTENRIAVERGRFNDTVQAYNTAIRSFPTMFFARMIGLRPPPLFPGDRGLRDAAQGPVRLQPDPGAGQAVTVRGIGFAWVALAAARLGAQEVMPASPAAHFNDYAGVVSPQTSLALDQKLAQFERDSSNQVVVAIYPKMESDSSVQDYTFRVAQAWHVGLKGTNNGAVLFIFTQSHQMCVQVGYGLEGKLTDATAKRIISDEIAPRFRSGDYDAGVTAGVNALLAATRGEYKGTASTFHGIPQANAIKIGFFLFFVIGFFVLSFASRQASVYNGRGHSGFGTGLLMGMLLNSGRGGGGGFGGGGFGGGGGGGFSGGGGSFGGGGAGGSW